MGEGVPEFQENVRGCPQVGLVGQEGTVLQLELCLQPLPLLIVRQVVHVLCPGVAFRPALVVGLSGILDEPADVFFLALLPGLGLGIEDADGVLSLGFPGRFVSAIPLACHDGDVIGQAVEDGRPHGAVRLAGGDGVQHRVEVGLGHEALVPSEVAAPRLHLAFLDLGHNQVHEGEGESLSHDLLLDVQRSRSAMRAWPLIMKRDITALDP